MVPRVLFRNSTSEASGKILDVFCVGPSEGILHNRPKTTDKQIYNDAGTCPRGYAGVQCTDIPSLVSLRPGRCECSRDIPTLA